MINMEINYEDCAVVFRPNGGIDVYCPDLDHAAKLPNVQLLRGLLIALVTTVSASDDVKELLAEIEQHMSGDSDTTIAIPRKNLH